ncbi:hypothetical protein KCU78_g9502, partial [Aureobasidium melanogenum]
MSGAYPHFQDYYDNESRSDVVLCFANKKIHAHKLILAGASELFHTAFKSNFQVASQAEFEIKGYPPEVIHAMLRHMYGFPYNQQFMASSPSAEQLPDFWVGVLLIANEYRVQSLTAAATNTILAYLGKGTCPTAESIKSLPQQYKENFARTVLKVSELYHNNNLADTSCLDGMIGVLCQHGVWIYEEHMQIGKTLEALEPFAIHAACRDGQINLAESLLNANPKLAKLRDDDDRLPIHWAASYNRLPIVEILSDRKDFDPDVQDGAGWTPLMIASSLKDSSASETLTTLLLAKNADPTLTTNTGATALHFAASKTNLDTAKKLLEHKASARVKDKRGQLPLHRAAAVGNVPMVKLMLANRSPVNATDADGCTALHHAIAEGHGDTAVVLLKAGAETDKKDSTGALALDLAPDAKVRDYIVRAAEEEGITL